MAAFIFLIPAGFAVGAGVVLGAMGASGQLKRSVADDMAYHTIFQLDADDLRMSDVRRLSGMQMNVTGMPQGEAVFSSQGDNAHEGITGVQGSVYPEAAHGGLQRGNLSFNMPGAFETAVFGTWIVVSQSTAPEDKETVKTFEELYEGLHSQGAVAKAGANIMDAIMQVRRKTHDKVGGSPR